MKNKYLFLFILLASIFSSCKDNDTITVPLTGVIPGNVIIDIPEALSKTDSMNLVKNDSATLINGTKIYENLRNYIYIGEASSLMMQNTLNKVSELNIKQTMNTSYLSTKDNRIKNVSVHEQVSYSDSRSVWDFELIISDNGNKALEIVWNLSPLKGIVTMQPHYLNLNNLDLDNETMYKITFNSAGNDMYEETVEIEIAGLPVNEVHSLNPDNLKMFVGKNADTIDVYGNSNHPNAVLYDSTNTYGLNWMFIARADQDLNIGVAKIALPYANEFDTTDVWTEYAMDVVISKDAHKYWDPRVGDFGQPYVDSIIGVYMQNTNSPAYYDTTGFVSCGKDSIPDHSIYTDDFLNLPGAGTYIPNDIKELTIKFLSD